MGGGARPCRGQQADGGQLDTGDRDGRQVELGDQGQHDGRPYESQDRGRTAGVDCPLVVAWDSEIERPVRELGDGQQPAAGDGRKRTPRGRVGDPDEPRGPEQGDRKEDGPPRGDGHGDPKEAKRSQR
jgi:hypothetical protein